MIHIFHDRGQGPEDLEQFRLLLKRSIPQTDYDIPHLPHLNTGIKAEDSFKLIAQRNHFPSGTVVIGFGLGGLLAAKLQETQDLTVIAIASPTQWDGVRLKTMSRHRLAIYSSHDEHIMPFTNWADFTDEAFECTPLMFHDIDDNRYKLARIVKEYLQGGNFKTELGENHDERGCSRD
jgi:hypothetical protein